LKYHLTQPNPVGIFSPSRAFGGNFGAGAILAAFEQTGPFFAFFVVFWPKAMVTVYALAKMI